MGIPVDHWEYVLSLIVGSAVVAVHANALYGQRVSDDNVVVSSDPLGSLPLVVVLGQRNYRRGFALYLFANLLLYLILASSTTILALTFDVIGQQNTAGFLVETLDPNLLYPIVASSVVVIMTQSRPTSGIEQAFRRFAHSVAGIPRNLELVQTKIHHRTLDESELVKSAEKSVEEIVNGIKVKSISDTDKANFKASLTRVFCFYQWTLGYRGTKIWSSDDSVKIRALFSSLTLEYHAVEITAREFSQIQPKEKTLTVSDSERWKALVNATHTLETRLTTALALLLINQPDADLDSDISLNKLRGDVLKTKGNELPNVISLIGQSLLIAALPALTLAVLHTASARVWRNITKSISSNIPEFPEVIDLSFSSRLVSIPFELAERGIDRLSSDLYTGLKVSINYSIVFAIAASVAMVVRNTRIESHQWFDRDAAGIPRKYPPVATYLYIGLLGYVCSTAVFFIWKFFELNYFDPMYSDTRINVDTTMRFFGELLPSILFHSLTAFVCAWFVLSYADKEVYTERRSIPFKKIMLFAFLCFLVEFSQKLIRQDFPLSTSLATTILASFSAFVPQFFSFVYVYNKQVGSCSTRMVSVERRDFIERRSIGDRRSKGADEEYVDRRVNAERRRTTADRRTVDDDNNYVERRSGSDRRISPDRRVEPERRKGQDRRTTDERKKTYRV